MEKIWVPVADAKSPAKFRLEEQVILFPHRIIAYLFDEAGLSIHQRDINLYWDRAIASGEGYASASSRDRIPLGVYGDAAQLNVKIRKEKIFCIWLNIPIFRPRSIRYSRFLLWACDSSLLYLNRTSNTALRWITWSLNALYHGKYPNLRPGNRALSQQEQDLAGRQITSNNHLFQVVEVRGDWEFQKMLWSFSSSWKGINVCYRCPALSKSDNPSMLYWNDSDNSVWATTEYTTAEFISKQLPPRHICGLPASYGCFRK